MSESGERTEAEREAARLERERRRAAAEQAAESNQRAAAEPVAAIEAQIPDDGAPRGEEPDGQSEFTEAEEALPPPPPRARSAARPVRGRTNGSRRVPRQAHGSRVVHRVVALVLLAVAVVAVWFVFSLFQPFHGSGHGSVEVTIPRDATASQIGDMLAREGIVSSGFFFELRATLAGDRGDLVAGTFRLPLGTSYSNALRILTTPPPAKKVTYVTIIPGHSRVQVSALLHSQHVRGSYLAATRHSRLLDPAHYGAPRRTPSLEGFLFPDTYQLYEPIGIPALVNDQLTTFKHEFAGVSMRDARAHHLTPYDVLIIASLVEGEASTARDLGLVSSVIYNRLAQGMDLGLDATTRYATGNYTSPLTVSQINSPSPWNTRNHPGLPPTPINSPGLAAIKAAAHPPQTNDLYFVVKPCGNGAMTFTASYSQFLADSNAYQEARARLGGRSPEFCKAHRK